MKTARKKFIVVILAILFGVLSIVRICHVNTVQHVKKINTFKVGEMFKYQDFQIEVTKAEIYTATALKNKYQDVPEDAIDENNIIIKLRIKKIGKNDKELDIGAFTIQDGVEGGGGTNPYLYPYLNSNSSGMTTFEKSNEQTIILAFPIERTKKYDKNLKLILALYPEKYEVKL